MSKSVSEVLPHSLDSPVHELRVTGMDCAGCAVAIEAALTRVDGVRQVQVDVMRGTVRVAGDKGVGKTDLTRAIRGAGYGVQSADGGLTTPKGRTWAAVVSGAFLAVGLILGWLDSSLPSTPFHAVSLLVGGWYVVPKGIRSARSKTLDINFLMTIAAIGAALIGEWAEAASAMFLFAVAQLLEGFAMGRARRAIGALMKLSPREAVVVRGGNESLVPVADVEVGEVIVTRPGERVALDGIVAEGRSALDQSPITGESMPVEKEPGGEVFAGSINGHGALHITVTHHAEDTTLARILHAVEEAQASRAPSQTFVDRFARIYTPAVVALAFLIAIGPPLLAGGAWLTWIYRALALLVIACPCALVISTPVTIVSSLTAAARDGVLIKGGGQLEAAGGITTVVFDKTGTITEGRPVVTDVIGIGETTVEEVLRLAAAVERHSEHPVARAVVAAAAIKGIVVPPTADFEAIPGQGAKATVEGRVLYLGNVRVCEALGNCHLDAHSAIDALELRGRTAILLTTNEMAIGVLGIADASREGAAEAIAALRASGVRRVLMLTGDNERVAREVAGAVGVDDVHAGLLPLEKQNLVTALRRSGERVAVVGDGVNDAPALAAADLGIAMGGAGTHVALETADIVLMGDDLDQIPATIRRSRRALRLIKQNITFSLVIKAVFLALAVVGQATLWMAVAADTGASLIVIGNGLRALQRSTT
jgi:Cd2+/Zn2+-exporting ATPase